MSIQTHGEGSERLGRSPEYRSWRAMRARCKYQSQASYGNYGGRGISVCHEWDASFERFLKDMGRKPSADCEIDRLDVNGPYAPWNCRWLSRAENRKKKRNAVYLTAHGITLSQAEWSRRTGISRGTIQDRRSLGWPDEEIVSLAPGCGRWRRR